MFLSRNYFLPPIATPCITARASSDKPEVTRLGLLPIASIPRTSDARENQKSREGKGWGVQELAKETFTGDASVFERGSLKNDRSTRNRWNVNPSREAERLLLHPSASNSAKYSPREVPESFVTSCFVFRSSPLLPSPAPIQLVLYREKGKQKYIVDALHRKGEKEAKNKKRDKKGYI